MTYEVTRKQTNNNKTFTNIINQDQLNNIIKYPSSLYTIESISPIEENKTTEHETIEPEEIKKNDARLTEQQKAVKQLIKDLNLKYDTVINTTTNIYINKNRKIKNIQDILYYALQYKIISIGEYSKIGDYISVFRNGIQGLEHIKSNGKIKIEMYREDAK
jgi:hypothetical protein